MAEESPKFLCDAMLGSLARWLRLLGYDTEFDPRDDPLILERARKEGRWLLTKDRPLAAKGPRTMLLRSEDLEDQLVEVLSRLNLKPDPACWGSRCAVCNGVVSQVAREDVAALVPPYVLATAPSFRRCNRCGRVYWRGSHSIGIEQRIARVLDKL